MQTFHDLDDVRVAHCEGGGVLLQTGEPAGGSRYTYVVCMTLEEAVDLRDFDDRYAEAAYWANLGEMGYDETVDPVAHSRLIASAPGLLDIVQRLIAYNAHYRVSAYAEWDEMILDAKNVVTATLVNPQHKEPHANYSDRQA